MITLPWTNQRQATSRADADLKRAQRERDALAHKQTSRQAQADLRQAERDLAAAKDKQARAKRDLDRSLRRR